MKKIVKVAAAAALIAASASASAWWGGPGWGGWPGSSSYPRWLSLFHLLLWYVDDRTCIYNHHDGQLVSGDPAGGQIIQPSRAKIQARPVGLAFWVTAWCNRPAETAFYVTDPLCTHMDVVG